MIYTVSSALFALAALTDLAVATEWGYSSSYSKPSSYNKYGSSSKYNSPSSYSKYGSSSKYSKPSSKYSSSSKYSKPSSHSHSYSKYGSPSKYSKPSSYSSKYSKYSKYSSPSKYSSSSKYGKSSRYSAPSHVHDVPVIVVHDDHDHHDQNDHHHDDHYDDHHDHHDDHHDHHDHHYGSSHDHAMPTTISGKEDWFNRWQQYRTPKLHFKASKLPATYAICTFDDDGDNKIQFSQQPGAKSVATWNIERSESAATTYEAVLFSTQMCKDSAEYNPLDMKDSLGRSLSYQEPGRGTLAYQVSETSGSGLSAVDKIEGKVQNDVCLNLSGPDCIIGRTIQLYTVDITTDPDNPAPTKINKFCCTIGFDDPPASAPTAIVGVHHHHTDPHFYGSYGGHGHH